MPVNNGNNDKYLDKKGLSYLWTKIKNMFALKSHTHSISQVSGLQTELNGKVDFINNDDAQIASKKSLYVQGVVSAQLIAGTTDSTSTAVIVGSSSSNLKGAYVKPYGKSSYYEILDASNYKTYFNPDNFNDTANWLVHLSDRNEVGNGNRPLVLYGSEIKKSNGNILVENNRDSDTLYFNRNGAVDELHLLKRQRLTDGMGFTVYMADGSWREFRLPSDGSYGTLATEDYVNNRMRSLNSISTLNKMSVNNDEVEALNAKITALEKRIADLEAKLSG